MYPEVVYYTQRHYLQDSSQIWVSETVVLCGWVKICINQISKK